MSTQAPVLSVRDLRVRFGTRRGVAHVVNGISYDLHRGETLAIVGESGRATSARRLARTAPATSRQRGRCSSTSGR